MYLGVRILLHIVQHTDYRTLALSFCYACLPSGIFEWVKGPHDSIVLVVSLLRKDQVALP